MFPVVFFKEINEQKTQENRPNTTIAELLISRH